MENKFSERNAKARATNSAVPRDPRHKDVADASIFRQGKVQTTFDTIAARTIVDVSAHYGVSQAEIIRTAVRLYTWASKQVRSGRDVGALDQTTGKFVAIDVPYPIPTNGT